MTRCISKKTDKDCGIFWFLNAYYFLNGHSRCQDEDLLTVTYWMEYQCYRFYFEFQKMKEKVEIDENEVFKFLSISRDIQIKNLSSLISPKDWQPSHYENVFKDITAIFFLKKHWRNSSKFKSRYWFRKQRYDKNEESYENEKIATMAKFKTILTFTGILSLAMLKK